MEYRLDQTEAQLDAAHIKVFASNAAVRMIRKSLCNTETWRYEEFADKAGAADGKKGRQVAFTFYDGNIESSITDTIKTLVNSSKLNLGRPYDNVVALVGSPANFSLLGLSSLSEDYTSMKMAFGKIFEQIDKLNGTAMTLKINGRDVNLKLRVKIGGDFKAESMLLGHGGAASKYHCPVCEGTKTQMKSWDVNFRHAIRSGYVLGEKNISKEPLLKTVTPLDVVIPVNHVLTGTVKKAMGLLNRLLQGESTEWNDEKEDRLNELSQSIAVGAGGINSIQILKREVIAMRSATEQIDLKRTILPDHCHKLCLYKTIPDTGKKWDLIPCTTCTHSNHAVCGRFGSDVNPSLLKSFRCIDCSGESKTSLMMLDMDHIHKLEEAETEIMETMAIEEGEMTELTRDESRTSERLTSAMEELKIKCGVYSRYYYADLVGEDARRLTRHENAIKLWNLIDDEKVRTLGVQLFDTIHGIFKHLHTGYQSPAEIAEFDSLISRLQELWSQLHPTESVPLKIHSLVHISDAMKREGHGGREIELIEHSHHVLNILLPKYATLTPLHRRLAIVVNRVNCKRFLMY